MKVLLATDSSERDDVAIEFVERARWAPGTQIELFGVLRPGLAVPSEVLEQRVRDLDAELDELAISLAVDSCALTWGSVIGEPVEMITARARMIDADLIVVGSRGRSPLAAGVLGSVAAGVLDHAPCPVLVVRRPTIGRVVLAEDGSPGSAIAAKLVREWPMFSDSSVEVVTVLEPSSSGRARTQALPHLRAHELVSRVRRSKAAVRAGDPGEQILEAAHDFAANLIVMGSRGETGLTRLLTGSVARHVLLRAKCSVLIARASAEVVHDRDPGDPLLARIAPWPVGTR